MRLATIKTPDRDGALAIVDREFKHLLAVPHIAPTLQRALENWDRVQPQLAEASDRLNADPADAVPYDVGLLGAPLPRTYQMVDAGIYYWHMWAMRTARGDVVPADYFDRPLMYQGAGDPLLSATEPLRLPEDAQWGVDIEAEVAVITDDVPIGTEARDAARHIRLLVLLNDFSLRSLIPVELKRGFGFFQGKPASSLSPVAVTPDELGNAWDGSLLHGHYLIDIRGERLGDLDPGEDTSFTYADLIAHAVRSRELRAGALVGAGALASADSATRGYGCIAEARAHERINSGEERTEYLRFGDSCRLEMTDSTGRSLFGAIEQKLERYQ
jgi:fumarylacetoacetate (FAA) hydrolase